MPAIERECPDCELPVKDKGGMNTDWYGYLRWWYCPCCEETFVERDNDGELSIAAGS